MIDKGTELIVELYQIEQLLRKLSIAYSIDKVNDDIIHIILWHGNEKFRMRFARSNCYDNFVLTGFLKG